MATVLYPVPTPYSGAFFKTRAYCKNPRDGLDLGSTLHIQYHQRFH